MKPSWGWLALMAALAAPARARQDSPAVDLALGKQAFQLCAACHSISRDGAHAMGPNLFGIVGRKAGSAAGFRYSKAMRGAAIVWTPEELAAFVADPRARIPNNAMPYPGLADGAARQALLAYLHTLK